MGTAYALKPGHKGLAEEYTGNIYARKEGHKHQTKELMVQHLQL